jgi:hypothetical protein
MHLVGVYLMGVDLIGVYFIGVDLIGMHLMGVHLLWIISLTRVAPDKDHVIRPKQISTCKQYPK